MWCPECKEKGLLNELIDNFDDYDYHYYYCDVCNTRYNQRMQVIKDNIGKYNKKEYQIDAIEKKTDK